MEVLVGWKYSLFLPHALNALKLIAQGAHHAIVITAPP